MTLAQIIQLALRQLDEDTADVSEYDDLFRRYANEGYQIVMRDIYKPRAQAQLETDGRGEASLEGLDAVRVIELRGEDGREVCFRLSGDGARILTREREKRLYALVQTQPAQLTEDGDEPAFPEWAHSVLADYICYRHLSAGSAAKQSRAQFFLNQFWQNARRIRPRAEGAATGLRWLYEATDARYVR